MVAKNKQDGGILIVTRHLNYPRELVFDAFTPEHMHQWMWPNGGTLIKATVDFRTGGTNHFGLHMPDGSSWWGKCIYREVTRPTRLVYVQSFSDEAGNTTRHPMSATWPREMLTTISFEAVGTGTQINIQWSPINATEEEQATFNSAMNGMNQGWKITLDQLEQHLAGTKH